MQRAEQWHCGAGHGHFQAWLGIVDERQVLPRRLSKGAFHVGIVVAGGLLVNGSAWMVCSPPVFWFKQAQWQGARLSGFTSWIKTDTVP